MKKIYRIKEKDGMYVINLLECDKYEYENQDINKLSLKEYVEIIYGKGNFNNIKNIDKIY